MNSPRSPYRGYRFSHEIISYCVWLYFRFSVSYRDIEELMAERGVTVTYESIRAWCFKFGQDYAKRIRARRGQLDSERVRAVSIIRKRLGVAGETAAMQQGRL